METYTIFQIKEDILNLEDALDQDAQHTPFALSPDFPLQGTLFLGQQRNAVPTWVQLLNPHLQAPLPNIHTAGISAVLIVRYQDRLYAVTFGHGKSLLHPTSWVRNFGLKVTLNRVNPGKLRSMDSRVYDELVVSTRRQTSKSSQLDNFELDINRSLLKGVTGDAEEGEVFTRLTGADGLKITTSLDFAQLDELLEEILAAFEDDVYRDRFGWIDNIREVEAAETEPLNDLLVASLRDEAGTDAYLAPPDTIEWSEIRGFNFTGGQRTVTYAELSIASYLGILRHHGTEIDVPLLKRHRVRVREEGDDQLHDKWSIYDCLVWETMRLGHRYALFDGLWFEIDVNFANRVDNFVEQLTVEEIDFSPALLGEDEEIYNLRFATMEEGRYAVLDRAVFRPEGALSPIEFCDLLSLDRELIHVKKRYSSASLSHLFSQGAVSAELFLQDQLLRNQVREKLVELHWDGFAALIPEARPRAADYEIVYAVIAEGEEALSLPFFSKVNLMRHASRLQNLNFRVSLQFIRVA